jgi:hypothetical protein
LPKTPQSFITLEYSSVFKEGLFHLKKHFFI